MKFNAINISITTLLSGIMYYAYTNQSMDVMIYCLFLLFAYLFYNGMRNLTDNITFVVFLVSIYTFLMGRVTLGVFMDTTLIHSVLGSGDFSHQADIHIYCSLFLALLFFFYGYVSVRKDKFKQIPCLINNTSYEVLKVRKQSRKLMYMTVPFNILITLEIVWFVINHGYFEYYLNYESRLPYIITLIAYSYEFLFFFFLATLPSKSEAKWPILIYILIGVCSLGSGQRGRFVLSVLLVVTYLFLRNYINNDGEKWITRRHIMIMAAMLPIFLGFLFAMSYMRTDRDVETSFNFILAFLYQQGVSVEVIGYGFDYESFFPPSRLYLFGDIVDYFRHNFIAKLFFGAKSVEPQSIDHALNDYAFDATLTYYVKSNDYLNGVGLGSSYIAEAWHDLGYFGIGFVSYIYGYILAKVPLWCKTSVWKAAAALLMYINIIYAPRSRADKFIYVFISFVVVAIYGYLYFTSRSKIKNYENN